MRTPFESVRWIVDHSAETGRFRGCCFGFRRSGVLLTAAHCVRGVAKDALTISMHDAPIDLSIPRRDRGLQINPGIPISDIAIHPTADLAIIKFLDVAGLVSPFADFTPGYSLGDEVCAFGYPEDVGESGVEPTPRFFRGSLQRAFRHKSHLDYEYPAGELSFGAPAGLSGGPVSLRNSLSCALGVVTENLESSTYIATVSELRDGDREYKEVTHSLINYGLCILLCHAQTWLDEHVPVGESSSTSGA